MSAMASRFPASFLETYLPPEDIGTYGHLIEYLFNYTTYLNLFYFALVCIGLFGFSFLYYYKRHPKPYYTYGNKKKHILIVTAIGLAVFFSIDANITRISNNQLIETFWNFPTQESERAKGKELYRVQVLAQQWAWNFRYPGPDDRFNTEDDIVTLNELVLPQNRKVSFQITSKDVLHSFYLPNFRMKVDAIPGRITRMWAEPVKTGRFEVVCAEMCGTHHYLMKAYMTVYNQTDFALWQKEAEVIAQAQDEPENLSLFWGWRWDLSKSSVASK